MSERKTLVSILLKGDQTGVIAMDLNVRVQNSDQVVQAVGSYDPRCFEKPLWIQGFADAAEAEKQFLQSLAVSRDRGWTVAYTGPRNLG